MTTSADRANGAPPWARAHGKVILFGEHAVVYGTPAIAVGIERGARATASVRAAEGPSTLHVRTWNITVRDDDAETPLARAFRDLLAATRSAGAAAGGVRVEADADLPPGGGLGCSAAVGVAIARALDPSADGGVIAERVGAWEQVFHGNPSGVDAAVSALGGCVRFTRGASGEPAKVTHVRVPGPVHLCVGSTRQASSTRSMVEAVARLRERKPELTQKTFEAIRTLVDNAQLAIEAGDGRACGELLDLNQMLLASLFVSTPEIEQMCALARGAGALGSKLTGAGGGGCVLALVDAPETGARVLATWKASGYDGFLTTFGAPRRAAAPSARELVQGSLP